MKEAGHYLLLKEPGVYDPALYLEPWYLQSSTVCVDPSRVYATGYSMGSVMAHKLGCDLSDRIATIAPVAGQNLAPLLQPCTPARPVPVFYVHGTADTTLY